MADKLKFAEGPGALPSRCLPVTRRWLRSKLATSRVARGKKDDDAELESLSPADTRRTLLPLVRGGGGGGGEGRRPAAAAFSTQGGSSSLFRSEPVVLVQLYLQAEVAHAALEELGEAGTLEFRDLNVGATAIQRPPRTGNNLMDSIRLRPFGAGTAILRHTSHIRPSAC
ncbi:hypothetical protein T492DRAFT_833445 [Pavlovales sp. CCMP2436]|nr:hypothetical protein T492DRAFT_833445 [Pavlovales sp. CCMP2436]